jgi:murein DD-endopeptidase MepM/ murein hydrolase activator NlpD
MPSVRLALVVPVAVFLAAAVPISFDVEGSGSAGSPSATGRGPPTAVDAATSGNAALSAPALVEPAPGPAYGTYAWPVRGPVLRAYDPPETPFGSGHRGIDIGAPMGSPIVAAHDGVVAFAGPVAGNLFVSIDHPDGVRTTYSWLSRVDVGRGDPVRRGDPIGRSGAGHPGAGEPHLHFGARIGTVYIDPMLLLERGSVVGLVHLAPLDQTEQAG